MNHSNRYQSKTIVKATLVLGLLVGTLDILSAIIDYYLATGKGPAGVFKYIASAVLGRDAFTGGAEIILLGSLLHYLIAFLFTIFFVVLYIKTNLRSMNKLLLGVLYGIFVWATMHFVVVPLSQTPAFPFVLWKAIKAMLILIVMIGLPLAFLAGRFLKPVEE